MQNICAALAAALLLTVLTACGGKPAEAEISAPSTAGQAGDGTSSVASAAEEDSSLGQIAGSSLPDTPSLTASAESSGVPSDDVIRPEFQQAMDSYEAFFDEYCDFMRRYSESDGTDLDLLADYADIMEQYAQVTTNFSSWDGDDLTAAELALYLDVQTRVNQKLLEFSA